MGNRYSSAAVRLGAALRGDEESKARKDAVKEIGKALSRAGGNLSDACLALEVSLKTMHRWAGECTDLEAEIRRIREAKGVPHYFGDPARSKVDPKPKAPRRRRAARAET